MNLKKRAMSALRGTCMIVVLAATAACNRAPAPTLVVQAKQLPVGAGRLNTAENESGNWLTHGRTYSEQRFSPLTEINLESVKALKLAWYLDLPAGDRGQESTPLVVDGVMFVTTSWSHVLAVDASTGKLLWSYDPKVPGEWAVNACCDTVNRGVAFWQGKVYVGTLDGRVVALGARDGKLLWQTVVIDRAERSSITGAPRVIKGRVFIGSAGGEFGVRGRLTALNADTGAILWRFFTVPGDPKVPPENLHLPAAQQSWTGNWWTRGGGGTVWDAMAYDPALGFLYIGTGNGSPWPQSIRSPGGGDNLYVSSIIALKAETGEMNWFYQTTPGDEWGFDAASQLVLAELNLGGQRRSVLMQASANGFVYVLDRRTGELMSATPYVPVNWATGVDLVTGRPKETPNARYSRTGKPFVVHPGPQGAHSWHPMAYSLMSGLLYIPAMVNSAEISVNNGEPASRYAITKGAKTSHPVGAPPDSTRLIAWDPVRMKAIWNADSTSPISSGVLATGGSLVFQGTSDGKLNALSADDGKNLWQFDVGTSITAAPITYQVGETQIIAVIAGAGGARTLEGGADAAAALPKHNIARLLAFSLAGAGHLPSPPQDEKMPTQPSQFGSPEQLSRGATLFAQFCERCHGEGAVGAGPLKDLRHSLRLVDARQWNLVVFAGLLNSTGMPGFMAEVNAGDAEALRAYVVMRANELAPSVKNQISVPPH